MNVAYSMKHAKGIEGDPKVGVNIAPERLVKVYTTVGLRQGDTFLYLFTGASAAPIESGSMGWREFPPGAVVTLTQD